MQSAWVAIWLPTVECCYAAILGATTDNASRSSRALAALRRGRNWAVCALFGVLQSCPASAATFTFQTPISGDVVPVTLTVSDAPGGNAVDVGVRIPPGEGDLLGLFGNLTDETLLPLIAVSDGSGVVAQSLFAANQVKQLGTGNNVLPVQSWDFGFRFGRAGSTGGGLDIVAFRLTAPGLTASHLTGVANKGWIFGVRIQSTNGSEGSSKIGLSESAPRLRIQAPPDGALLNASPGCVSGTVLGTDVAVTVDEVPAAVDVGAFTACVPLSEGPNTITATGTNAFGTATDSVDVVLDTLPPLVSISSPTDGTLTTEPFVTVTGTVADASPVVSFQVAGQPVLLQNGTFSTSVPLPLGDTQVVALAVDAAGNQGSAQIRVARCEPPSIAVEVPPGDALLSSSPTTVTGTATGFPAPGVTVNGVHATVSGTTFSAGVPLSEGPNALTAVATNICGSATDAVAVVLDTTPPLVTITAPADGADFSEQPIQVTGTAADASPIVDLRINGDPIAPGTSFVTTALLVEGPNTITVSATDAAGNTGSATISVTFTEVPPLAVSIDTPPNGAVVCSESITVAGSVGDPGAAVTVNGLAATVTGQEYVGSVVPLVEGTNVLAVTATLGNRTATTSVTVSRDVPPSVIVTSPPGGATIREAEVDVAGFVDDPAAFVDVNGVVASVGSAGAFLARSLPLSLGENALRARAIDVSGCARIAATKVNRDDEAPGRLRIVALLDFGEGGVQLVAADLESFKQSLERAGLPPEQFSPPIEDIWIGSDTPCLLHLFVFAEFGEIGAPVSLGSNFDVSISADSASLRPIADLEIEDLPSTVCSGCEWVVRRTVGASLAELLLPGDFVPNGFARFTGFKGCPE